MNKLPCHVSNIQKVDSVHLLTFQFGAHELKMMSLELNNIFEETKVNLMVKPTHVSIAKDLAGTSSIENILQGKVVDMERGKLLCNIKVKCNDILIESLITKESFNHMNLKLNDTVSVLIKASALSILEVIHD